MSYALKRAKHKHKAARKIAPSFYINELQFTVPVTAKGPGKVGILVLKNIYITKLHMYLC